MITCPERVALGALGVVGVLEPEPHAMSLGVLLICWSELELHALAVGVFGGVSGGFLNSVEMFPNP